MIITVEWDFVQRRSATVEVPDGSTPEQITELATKEVKEGRAGRMDQILTTEIGRVGWTAPDGRFGGWL